ncbi:MAG: hypothetical protein WBE26_15360 [Phycisphaerae bacterium]
MMRGRAKHIVGVVIFALMIVRPYDVCGDGELPLTGPATDNEIASLIRDLGDSSYEKRTFATRRLCAIGMPAADQLQAAAEGDDVESALRARAVLLLLDRIMFAGVEIQLSFSKTRIAWDESVDLNMTMVNRSKYPARVPFDIDPDTRKATTNDARQVGDMLDLADFLHVRKADASVIELTVDDIAADAAVVAAVQDRLNGGPSGVLEPGERVTLPACAFNRGWARYPLLDSGTYTVVMDYVPQWEDAVLAAQRVGRVVSNQATITVTEGAPASVSRGGQEASLAVDQEGSSLVAVLTNRTDQPMLINRNFGRSPPFAGGRWIWELDGARRDVPLFPKPAASWHDFDAALLVEVAPGQSIELARISVDKLRRAPAQAGAEVDRGRWTVHFAYVNLCDRSWQARQGSALLGNVKAPPIFQTPLPRRILSTRHTSNRLIAPGAD